MKSLFNIIYYFLIGAVAIIALLLLFSLVPLPGNFSVKVVKSGSMEPYIRTGGIVIVVPSSSYKVGDVVTFGADSKTQIPTTHRIIKIEGTGEQSTFTTKGDANDMEDLKVIKLSDIHGKVLFTVPYLGYILDFARRPLGFAFLVGLPAVAIIFDEIIKIIREVKNVRRKKQIINATEENQQPNKAF